MNNYRIVIALLCVVVYAAGTPLRAQDAKIYLGSDSTKYLKINFLNQVWLRFNQSNPGTVFNGEAADNTFDIGLRRTRLVLQSQLNNRAYLFFQIGMNNFNSAFAVGGNRKSAVFIHDALAEYRVSDNREVILGGGLTIANGLSRFSQPSVGTIMTTDVPVTAQATVDQTDEFSRKLTLFARGQVGPIDYRVCLSDPFPINSNGTQPPSINTYSQFTPMGHSLQQQAYVAWQFFDHEPHTTPYMQGTYLGDKKVFNIAAGIVRQPRAMWRLGNNADTVYEDMTLACIESFYDAPISTDGVALSAYAGFFHYNYGQNYLRFNGLMNPATGTSSTIGMQGAGPTHGNAYPMFGTGNAVYSQCGLFVPNVIGSAGLLPYASLFYANWDRVTLPTAVISAGCSVLFDKHRSKLSLDLQNRPTYTTNTAGTILTGDRKTQVTVQYQVML